MKIIKMKRFKSDKFTLSESFTVLQNDENNATKGPEDCFDQSALSPKDDSLNFSGIHLGNQYDSETPLLSVSTDIKEIIEDFIHECKLVDEFYGREKARISNNFEKFYHRFQAKINSTKNKINLDEDLKEQRLDGLGYSSSWARQFTEFYSKLAWLDGFAKINNVAIQKILIKFDNILFEQKSSDMYKNLSTFIKDLNLAHEDGCFNERRKIRSLVALHYYKNNMDDALKFLEFSLSDYQSEDRIPLSILIGMIIAMIIILSFFLLAEPTTPIKSLKEVGHILPIFRCTLSFIFALFCSGVVIVYLQEYRVNYVIIFESNPSNRLKPSSMYVLSAILLIIWMFCLIGQASVLRGFLSYSDEFFAKLLLIILIVIFFNPIKIFRSGIRFPIIAAMFMCCFSPFSEVRFMEFFIGDVLTSLVKPFVDVSMIACWFNTDTNDEYYSYCYPRMFWGIFAWYLPFHIRFWQCINKYFVTGDAFPHLVNAGKYLASIVMIIANYFYGLDPNLKTIIIFISLGATIYSYIWDIVMDWGLCRDSRMLRHQILYPPKYYYFCTITNLILRFMWVIPFIPGHLLPSIFRDLDFLTLFLCIAEIYRRAQWSLFRLENENINNYEKYRTILEIPRLPKD